VSDDVAVEHLQTADIDLIGRMPWSSNTTFLANLDCDPALQAVYKPGKGERPLWDFPDGLYKREIAAFELSSELSWGIVPPTVERDGPFGPGSLQLFIPTDFEQHYFTIKDDPDHRRTLQRICAFDYVANSTDRKSGHCLLGEDGEIHAIDNGLSFHVEFKLRTVIWDFGGEDLPPDLCVDLEALLDAGAPALDELLSATEVAAVLDRTRSLLHAGCFPIDPTGRAWPWPVV
jgi:uncharacterized repeat protein (TIGR03843 family)